jgi:hypothetical protein
MTPLIKFKKLFGLIRILLAVMFVLYPFSQYLNSGDAGENNKSSWMFALLFFILYAISALANGLREIRGEQPAFSLLRFFEITLNSFVAVYLIILLFALKLNPSVIILFIILAMVLAVSTLRDMRYISLQYYERKQKLNEKNKRK